MTVTMTLEEYNNFKEAKENLDMIIEAAKTCLTQDDKQRRSYYNSANKDFLIKEIANQEWDNIYNKYCNKPQI